MATTDPYATTPDDEEDPKKPPVLFGAIPATGGTGPGVWNPTTPTSGTDAPFSTTPGVQSPFAPPTTTTGTDLTPPSPTTIPIVPPPLNPPEIPAPTSPVPPPEPMGTVLGGDGLNTGVPKKGAPTAPLPLGFLNNTADTPPSPTPVGGQQPLTPPAGTAPATPTPGGVDVPSPSSPVPVGGQQPLPPTTPPAPVYVPPGGAADVPITTSPTPTQPTVPEDQPTLPNPPPGGYVPPPPVQPPPATGAVPPGQDAPTPPPGGGGVPVGDPTNPPTPIPPDQPPTGTTPPPVGTTPPPATGGGTGTTPGAPNSLESELKAFLKTRLNQSPTVDTQSAEFRSIADPYAAAQERARRQTITEAAERNSAKGLGDSGAMDIERRMATERAGQNVGSFESNLAREEMQSKRAEIQDALNKYGSMFSDEQKIQLQREAQDLDAAIRREGYGVQKDIAGQQAATTKEGYRSQEQIAAAAQQTQKGIADLQATLTREGRTFEGGEAEKNRALQEKLQSLSQNFTIGQQKLAQDFQRSMQTDANQFAGGQKEKDRVLEETLAKLDAEIKREGLAQSGQLGQADLDLRKKLGTGSLSVQLIQALLGDKQANNDLAARLGISEADLYARILGGLM